MIFRLTFMRRKRKNERGQNGLIHEVNEEENKNEWKKTYRIIRERRLEKRFI